MRNRFDKKAFDFFVNSDILDTKGFRRLRNSMPGRRGSRLGRSGRRGLLSARFDPDARDADNDGVVQEMTRWERPAGPRNIVQPAPRNIVQPLLSATQGGEEESDLDEILRNFERNRQRNRPFRLTAPDDDFDPDKPSKPDKPVVPGRRNRPVDRSRLIDPSKPVSADNIRNPMILPKVPGQPMGAEIKGMSKADWNNLIDEFEDYFQRMTQELQPKDKKLRSLYTLRDSLRKIKVTDSDDGIELDGRDWYYARIIKSFKAIKKQGTDFKNGDKLTEALEAELKRQGTSSRSIDLQKYWNAPNIPSKVVERVDDKKRDAKKVAQEIADLEKRVEKRFGKIETKQDALDAFRRAHPNIKSMFDFLEDENKQAQFGPLSPTERGLVFGYLDMFMLQPELKDYVFLFKPERNPNAAGSAGINLPWSRSDNDAKSGISFTVNYRSTSPMISYPGLAEAQRTGGKSRDLVNSQAALSMLKNNPDGLTTDREIYQRAEFVYVAKLAQHEATHIAHARKALEDAFPGVNGDGVKLMEIIKQEFADIGEEKALAFMYVGYTANAIDIFDETEDIANQFVQLYDQVYDSIVNQYETSKGRKLTLNEKRDAQADAVASMFYIQTPLGLVPSRNLGIWNKSFPFQQIEGPADWKKQTILDGRAYAQKRKTSVQTLLRSYEYKELNDAINEEIRKATRIDKNGKPVVYKRPKVEKAVLKNPDLARKFYKDLLNKTETNGHARFIQLAETADYYDLTFRQMLSKTYMDDLTDSEQQVFRNYGKQISEYAGNTVDQFYGYQSGNVPFEVIAELTGSLTSGQLPEKGTPEYAAVKKFIIWLHGPGYWNKLEES